MSPRFMSSRFKTAVIAAFYICSLSNFGFSYAYTYNNVTTTSQSLNVDQNTTVVTNSSNVNITSGIDTTSVKKNVASGYTTKTGSKSDWDLNGYPSYPSDTEVIAYAKQLYGNNVEVTITGTHQYKNYWHTQENDTTRYYSVKEFTVKIPSYSTITTSPNLQVSNSSSLSSSGDVTIGSNGSLSVSNNSSLSGSNLTLNSNDLSVSGNSTLNVSNGTLTVKNGAVKVASGSTLKAKVLRAAAATTTSEIGSDTKIDGSLTVAGQVHGVTAGTADTDAVNKKQMEDAISAIQPTGAVVKGDTHAVSGDTVKKALDSAMTSGSTDLIVKSITVSGDSTVSGNEIITGNQSINGNGSVDGSLDVGGATTLEDLLEVYGDATFDSNTTTKGNQTVNGTSDLKGDVTAESNVMVDKDLTVKGTTNLQNTNVSGNLDVQGDTTLKNTKVDGTFEATGNATFDGDTETKGNAKFDQNVDVDGNITAKGDISGANGSFSGDLNVTGKTTTGSLEVTGDSTIGGNEHVKGTFTADGVVTLNDTLEVKGKSTFDSDTETKGSSTIGKNLTVNGTTDLKGDVTAESNMMVNKDFTVKGTTSLQNTNVAGNLDVQGDTTLKNTKVDGTFETTGKAVFDGDTETKGSAAIGKNLTVSGTTDLKGDLLAEGNAIMNQDMSVKGSASIGHDFSVGGNTTLSGDTRIEKSLTVSGPATFSNDVHMDKNLSVDGNISTSGVITASDAIIGGKSINSTLENLGSAMDSKIDSVSHRLNQNINKAAAGAAALAALHPQDFDPDDKWDFAAGMGHYHDANSAALGVYYHPNEDTLVSLGSTMGNGDPMMNLGVSVKLGHGSGKTLSRAEMSKMLKTDREAMKVMVKNMIEMKKEIEALKANKVDSLKVSEISDKKTFPDVPTGHWANQAVTTLHDNHVVQGYPDGNFKGDRTMTRYEYAEMLYNALKRGLPVPQKQIDEYESELKKIAESRNESLPVSKAVKNSNKKAAVKAVKAEPAKSSVSVKK